MVSLRRLCIVLFLFTAATYGTAAQQYNSLFWMQGIPQSNYANPALLPRANMHFGFPGLSAIHLNASSRGFAIGDMVRRNEMDETYWDTDGLLLALDDHNLLQASVYLEWFSLGFRSNANYFSFNLSDKIDYHVAYPPELARLVLKGNNGFGRPVGASDFSGFEMDHLHFREFGVSYAREASNVFSFGLRARALFGIRNQWTERSAFELAAGPAGGDMLLHAEVLLNHASGQSLGLHDDQPFMMIPAYGIRDLRVSLKNAGGALDLGVVLRPADRLTLAISLLDLGFINWEDGAENYLISGSSVFDGIEPEYFFNSQFLGNMEKFLDGIPEHFDVERTGSGYRTTLAPKLIGSAGLALSERHQLALLARAMRFSGRLYPSYTLSYNLKPSNATGLSLAYSVANRSFSNIGLGMHANLGPFQVYVLSDNVLGFIIPNQVRWNSLQLGFNWVFGYRPEKEEPIYTW